MIKFGTSGFRGVFSDDFTKENVQKIAFAVVQILKREKKVDKPVYVGFDNRFMGCQFAKWVSEVLAFNDIKVIFYEKSMPSPLISFQTKENYVGIMITASHNHYYYNGIKFFLNSGRESDDEFNQKVFDIATNIDSNSIKTLDFDEAVNKKIIILTTNFENYINSVLSFVNFEKKSNIQNFKVLFNAMHGSATECMRIILDKIGVKYEVMKENLDPYFEYKVTAPYLDNIQDQIEKVKKEKFNFGFALDGDGDRISFIDRTGIAYDCNYISALIYNFLIKNKLTKKVSNIQNFLIKDGLSKKKENSLIKSQFKKNENYVVQLEGNIVKNNAVSELIVKTANAFGFNSFDAKVGFKNIANFLLSNNQAIIGVESNGIAIKKHTPYKDGVLIAAIIINLLISENKTLKELVDVLKNELQFPSETLEFAYPISELKKVKINNKIFLEKQLPQTPDKILEISYNDGLKMVFENGYWGVIRFSGTENVVRIFVEMKDKKSCLNYITIFEKFINVSQKQI